LHCLEVVASIVATAVTLGILIHSGKLKRFTCLHWLAAAWAILPPVWFLAEWAVWGPSPPGSKFEAFKYSQETARDVWAGVGALLALIVFKHDS
jgi:hypothetical protein